MRESLESLKEQLDDEDYRYGYAEAFLNSYIAAQIKILREQREMTQAALAEMIGTKQAGISRLENVNHTAWKVDTLTRLARAFDLRLRISFEEFGSLPEEVARFGREFLERDSYQDDAVFGNLTSAVTESSKSLSANEQRALAPGSSSNVVDFEQQAAALTGEKYARQVDSPSKSPSLYGTGGVELSRERFLAPISGGRNEAIPVRQQQQYGS